jgi:hypothetical protein
MNLVRHWIRNFPEAQKSAIADAFEIGQPGKDSSRVTSC